ncbi:twin-arginine translocase TatA/TatE family subunit [Patescibacteria group bacterium]
MPGTALFLLSERGHPGLIVQSLFWILIESDLDGPGGLQYVCFQQFAVLLPDLGRGLGKTIHRFREESTQTLEQFHSLVREKCVLLIKFEIAGS